MNVKFSNNPYFKDSNNPYFKDYEFYNSRCHVCDGFLKTRDSVFDKIIIFRCCCAENVSCSFAFSNLELKEFLINYESYSLVFNDNCLDLFDNNKHIVSVDDSKFRINFLSLKESVNLIIEDLLKLALYK